MNYPIQIIRVRSRKLGKEYYIAYPSADVDYVTDGLIVLVSKDSDEIQLHNADGDEYEKGPYEGGSIRADKENSRQNRSDLAVASIDLDMRSIRQSVENFAYHDIYVAEGHADAIERVSIADYLKSGGVINYGA